MTDQLYDKYPVEPDDGRPDIETYEPRADTKTAVVIASGPSLRGFNFADLDDPKLWKIAVNQEIRRQKDTRLDAWVFNDFEIADVLTAESFEVSDGIQVFEASIQRRLLPENRPWRASARWFLPRSHINWRPTDPGAFTWGTTATTAISIAAKLGFREIVLLGVDLALGPDQSLYYDESRTAIGRIIPGQRMRDGITASAVQVSQTCKVTSATKNLRIPGIKYEPWNSIKERLEHGN